MSHEGRRGKGYGLEKRREGWEEGERTSVVRREEWSRVTDAKSPRPCSDAALVFHSQSLHGSNSENYQMCIYPRPQRPMAGRFLSAGDRGQAYSDYSYKMVSVSLLLLLYYEEVLRPVVYHFFLPSKLLEWPCLVAIPSCPWCYDVIIRPWSYDPHLPTELCLSGDWVHVSRPLMEEDAEFREAHPGLAM